MWSTSMKDRFPIHFKCRSPSDISDTNNQSCFIVVVLDIRTFKFKPALEERKQKDKRVQGRS